nr:unnamed protein product [Digitaria exilis]CAB3504688.1 unnamed protein product [Digitaria exilis]
MSSPAMDQESERIPKKSDQENPLSHQNANLNSSGSRFARRRTELHSITAKSGGDAVGKVPETVEPTDSAKNRTKPSTSEEADSEPQIQRLTTANKTAQGRRKMGRRSGQTSNSCSLSPLLLGGGEEEGRRERSLRPGVLTGDKQAMQAVHHLCGKSPKKSCPAVNSSPAATVHRSTDIPMGHGREAKAL